MNKTTSWFAVCAGSALATVLVGRSMASAEEQLPLAGDPTPRVDRPTDAGRKAAGVPAWAEMIGTDVDAATGLPRFVRDKGSRIELVLIPAGQFRRGDLTGRGNDDERPAHQVVISKPFYLGRYEVTQAEWEAVVSGIPGFRYSPGQFQGDTRQPIADVSWVEANTFLDRVGMRLPTEAEWEYAARAGDAGAAPTNPKGWFNHNCARPMPVDGIADAANAWGMVGMFGNVREWCSDLYDRRYYGFCAEQGTVTDPTGPTVGDQRVVRGSDCGDAVGRSRYGDREHLHEHATQAHVGFRVARNP